MEFVEYEPEYIPEAVMNYYSCGVQVGRSTNNNKDLILKAKKHLAAIGWSFFYISKKPGRRELRYRSPAGKTYCSLRSACQDLIGNQEQYQDGIHDLDLGSSKTEIVTEKKTNVEKNDHEFSSKNRPQKRVRIQDDDHDHDQLGGTSKTEILTEKIKKLEEIDEVSIDNGRPQKKFRIRDDDHDLESSSSKIESFTKRKTSVRPIQDDEDHDLESSSSKIGRKTSRPQKKVRIQDDDHDLESSSSKIESFTERKTSVRPQKKIRIQDVEASYFHQKREESCVVNSSNDDGGIDEEDENEGFRNPDRPGKRLKGLMKYSGKKRDDFTPKKRVRKASDSSTRRRCVLSILIERKIVSRGTKVSYRGRKDGRVMAEGRVFEEGIQCDCCGDFFLLSKFEAHAGSTYRRPAANIFLDDGRSLLDCQSRLTHENEPKPTKSRDGNPEQDEFCSFCNDGGELLLCDSCTSSFHASCIGLNGVPDSDYWFCPFCCCQICHQDQISSLFTCEYIHKIKCKQCEHHFHTNCLKEKGVFVSSDTVNWLCSKKCENIFSGLMAIARKSIPGTVDNLSWTLLKLENDKNSRAEINGKLNVALDVMHECFEPVKHPRSDGDVVEDVVFSRRSKRSDFSGFFTAVLERDEEVIAVATVRVHGCKAAEIPLVATRFRYRKMGMCRILMDEIERVMEELGVERIVLPAVPEMVRTWTESFGFKVMDEIERLEVVECKFLDFPGTIKCQKILKKM